MCTLCVINQFFFVREFFHVKGLKYINDSPTSFILEESKKSVNVDGSSTNANRAKHITAINAIERSLILDKIAIKLII